VDVEQPGLLIEEGDLPQAGVDRFALVLGAEMTEMTEMCRYISGPFRLAGGARRR
jgi:hypothetical protein